MGSADTPSPGTGRLLAHRRAMVPHLAEVAKSEKLEQQYELLIALARRMAPGLARCGILILPDDLGDAVHEFWLSSKIRENPHLQAESPELAVYWRKALLRFALKVWRRKQRFVQLFDTEGFGLREPSGEEEKRVLAAQMRIRLQDVMAHELESSQTRLLLRFFEEGPRCERLLAREFSMTRYRVREEILNGVGTVLVHLSDLTDWQDPDRRVASEIWRCSHSLSETAMHLDLPLAVVREAHRRNLTYLRKLIL